MARSSASPAFTLIEALVTMAVMGLVLAGVTALFLQNLSIYHLSSGKLKVNRDIRTLTNELSEEARNANFFRVYPSFLTRFDDVNQNHVEDDGEDLPVGLAVGRAGDFLVLYYLDPTGALEPGTRARKIVRAVGYYRAPIDPDVPMSAGPVRKFVLTESPGTLPAPATLNDHREVVELSRGFASGRLFQNFGGSIVIQGEIEHPGNLVRRATNTYNFTIGPRG